MSGPSELSFETRISLALDPQNAPRFTEADRLSPRICVTIEAEQRHKMIEQCRREHRTQSEVIRLALRLYYDQKDGFGRPVTITHH